MKKVLLLISFLMITFSAAWAAAGLNPYAHNLKAEQTNDNRTLRISYCLNADAKSVTIEILSEDGRTVLLSQSGPTKETTYSTSNSSYTSPNTVDISIANLIGYIGKSLPWRITVVGDSPEVPTKVSQTYNFYCPQGVAVDNNPTSPNFGKIFVTETLHGRSIAANKNYYSKKPYGTTEAGTIVAGVYVLSPDFKKITANSTPLTGGIDFSQVIKPFSGFDGGHQPYRICISEDSRIFVSSGDKRSDNVIVWEIDKNNLNSWTPLIQGSTWNDEWQVTRNSSFYAGLNCSMDVTGSGSNLKLLLFSTNKTSAQGFVSDGFRLDEYSITSTGVFTGTPRKISALSGKYAVAYDNVNVIYDGKGGYWFGASRGENITSQLNLLHVNADEKTTNNSYYKDALHGGAGLKVHHSSLGEDWLFKGIKMVDNEGQFRVWKIDYNNDAARSKKFDVNSGNMKRNHNAFAIDYAENLFVVGNNGEKCHAYALPYCGTKTTPAAQNITLQQPTQLNPFAYNLYTTQEDDGLIALHFFLNANADRVLIRLIDEKGNKYLLRDYPTQDSDKDYVPYNDDGFKTIITKEDIERLNLPLNGTYTWEVEVNDNSVKAPTELPTNFSFFHPSSIDIDNNPENKTFGTIIANEAVDVVKNKSGYHSSTIGAGIYAFTPAFEAIKNSDGTYGYNGGMDFADYNSCDIKNGEGNTLYSYAPRRVRFSEDGRLFVTSLNPLTSTDQTHNAYLWEVNPENLSSWTPVFQNFTLNNEAELLAGSEFMAGPNTGFDVKGSGENLKLLMLSSNTQGMTTSPETSAFKLHEYNLSTNKSWSQAASRQIDLHNYIINNRGTQVEYDNDGGFWLCQYRVEEKEGEPTLLYFDANGNIRYKETFKKRCSGAIRFNKDFTKFIIAGDSKDSNSYVTLYSIVKDANGIPTGLEVEQSFNMPTLVGEINDFAFDYADNLYACANVGEKLVAYAMPYSGTVITPAAGRFRFQFTAAYKDAQLNPYAYRLKRQITAKDSLKIFYNINADADRLQVYFTDTQTQQDYLVRDYPSDPTATIYRDGYMDIIREKDVHNFNIPRGVVLDWSVKVYGKSPIKPVKPSLNVIPFFAPNSVAVDTNPESPYFGRVLVVETRHQQFTSGQSYYSTFDNVNGNLAGVYAFMPELVQKYWKDPDGKERWAPWGARQAYNGGKDFTSQVIHAANLNTYYYKSGQQPWMVRISEDGRIFVSAMDNRNDKAMVWELSQDLQTWNTLLTSDRLSCSMDVKGSGEDLKLLIYSTDKAGMADYTQANYHLYEYALGKNTTPTRINHFGPVTYGSVSYNAKIMYDKGTGGFWFGGGNTGADGEVYFAHAHKINDANDQSSYAKVAWGVKGGTTYSGGSGVQTHIINNEKILFKGVDNHTLQFYRVTYDNAGEPTLEDKGWGIQLSDAVDNRCSDFAVDYANNLYFTDGNHKQLMTVALPYSGEVLTPASSREQIIIPILADERSGVEAAPHVNQVDRAIVYRRLQAGMCNTICLPFDIDNKSQTPYANATFYEFTALAQGNDQIELQFSEVQSLEAGKPYLIQPNEDIVDTVRFRHHGTFVDFVHEAKELSWTINDTKITYHGVLAPTTIPKGALMLVANNRLAKASQEGQMQGLRGYFTVEGTMPSKAVLSFKQGTTTDDKTVVTPLPSTEVRKVLQDQQVFIIKDNEAYNILGEAVAL